MHCFQVLGTELLKLLAFAYLLLHKKPAQSVIMDFYPELERRLTDIPQRLEFKMKRVRKNETKKKSKLKLKCI